jgi:hypothetical protein
MDHLILAFPHGFYSSFSRWFDRLAWANRLPLENNIEMQLMKGSKYTWYNHSLYFNNLTNDAIYFGFTDSLKSPNAKKLLVMNSYL